VSIAVKLDCDRRLGVALADGDGDADSPALGDTVRLRAVERVGEGDGDCDTVRVRETVAEGDTEGETDKDGEGDIDADGEKRFAVTRGRLTAVSWPGAYVMPTIIAHA
jgi:hypothetical protein